MFETMKVQDDMQEDKFGTSGVANERRHHLGGKFLQLRTTKTQYSPQYSMEESSKVRNSNNGCYIYNIHQTIRYLYN